MKKALFISSVLFFMAFSPKSAYGLDIITPKIAGVQLPANKTIANLLLDDMTCYRGYEAFVFFSLAVIAKEFLSEHSCAEEEAIKNKISNYVSSGNVTTNMVKFFDELVNRYGGLEEQRIKEKMELTIGRSTYAETTGVFRTTIKTKIEELKDKLERYVPLENSYTTLFGDNKAKVDALLAYLYKNVDEVTEKLEEKRNELFAAIQTTIHKLDSLIEGRDSRKLYLVAGELSESFDNIIKVFNKAQKGDVFKKDIYDLLDTIRKASDVNPSKKLNTEILNSVIQLEPVFMD